jgi:hypothetical protein
MTNLSGSGGRSIGVNYATSAKNMGECFLTCKIHHSHDKFENALAITYQMDTGSLHLFTFQTPIFYLHKIE